MLFCCARSHAQAAASCRTVTSTFRELVKDSNNTGVYTDSSGTALRPLLAMDSVAEYTLPLSGHAFALTGRSLL